MDEFEDTDELIGNEFDTDRRIPQVTMEHSNQQVVNNYYFVIFLLFDMSVFIVILRQACFDVQFVLVSAPTILRLTQCSWQ